MDHSFLIAIGGNLTSSVGKPAETLRVAINCLVETGAVIRATSHFYHTPAFPAGAGPDYVNAALCVDAACAPCQMLDVLHRIEAQMGRERVQRWGQRTLDLDLIACGDSVLPDRKTYQLWRDLPLDAQMGQTPDQLILPHPRIQDRAFVLVPLADIAPDWVHPVLGLSVAQMLADLSEDMRSQVRKI